MAYTLQEQNKQFQMRLLACLLISCAFRCNSQSFSWTRDFKTNYNTYGRQVLADTSGNAYVISDYYYYPNHEPSINGCD